jgi:hypothetical protein
MLSRGSRRLAEVDQQRQGKETGVFRIPSTLVVIWLLIGVLAGWQRHYYRHGAESCAKAGTIVATIAAGPLNYVGANPKVHCKLPHPSN